MMRSMYSAVSGLKTHQTKMDVIGNNIANVNTVAFKSSSVTFQDILYQNTSGATGANAQTGVGGVNGKQIGLGVSLGATNVNITSAGAAETTGGALDIRLNDQSTTNFFIVNNGSENLFTRSGSFYVDGSGNLCMTSTGYTVMGWQVDPTTGNIRKDTVSALRVMQAANLTSPPEATTNGTFSGIIDKNDTDVLSDTGMMKNLTFYDKLGYSYTARFSIKATLGADGKPTNKFTVSLDSILDEDGNAIVSEDTASTAELEALFGIQKTTTSTYIGVQNGFFMDTADNNKIYLGEDNTGTELHAVTNAAGALIGYSADGTTTSMYTLADVFGVPADLQTRIENGKAVASFDAGTGELSVTNYTVSYDLEFSAEDGTFVGINGNNDAAMLNLAGSGLAFAAGGNFENISIDFSGTKNSNNGGKSTATMAKGATDGTTGAGKKLGAMIGLSVNNYGEIYGTYDNGNTTLLGQIAVAQFANASGLEKSGDNCYRTTLNSGEFDGIGVEVSADGSKMTSGELEMSNVDLSTEFTQMIVTQRGFQANSRVITTSDTLLEELVNLKR